MRCREEIGVVNTIMKMTILGTGGAQLSRHIVAFSLRRDNRKRRASKRHKVSARIDCPQASLDTEQPAALKCRNARFCHIGFSAHTLFRQVQQIF